jgi:hypothetical protein
LAIVDYSLLVKNQQFENFITSVGSNFFPCMLIS